MVDIFRMHKIQIKGNNDSNLSNHLTINPF